MRMIHLVCTFPCKCFVFLLHWQSSEQFHECYTNNDYEYYSDTWSKPSKLKEFDAYISSIFSCRVQVADRIVLCKYLTHPRCQQAFTSLNHFTLQIPCLFLWRSLTFYITFWSVCASCSQYSRVFFPQVIPVNTTILQYSSNLVYIRVLLVVLFWVTLYYYSAALPWWWLLSWFHVGSNEISFSSQCSTSVFSLAIHRP